MKKRGYLEYIVFFISVLLACVPFYVADVFAEEENLNT